MDVALWDIAGKIAGLPIHQLLGSYRDRIPAYISSAVLAAPEAYADEAQHYKALNMAAYKIHPPQIWRDDIKVCEAVRKAVGDDYTLMLDSVWSYDYPAALRVGQAIEALGFYWEHNWTADGPVSRNIRANWQDKLQNNLTNYVDSLLLLSSNELGKQLGKAKID
jgi:L-alanine-DL-glutamate epimerase-like enolase superfamily enzyme